MIKSEPDCENYRVMRRRSIAGGLRPVGVRHARGVELEAEILYVHAYTCTYRPCMHMPSTCAENTSKATYKSS